MKSLMLLKSLLALNGVILTTSVHSDICSEIMLAEKRILAVLQF